MNTYLLIFLAVLLVLCTLHTALKSWYQDTVTGGPPYVDKEDSDVIIN